MNHVRGLAMLAVAVSVFGSCTSQAPLPPGAIRIPTDQTLTNAATSRTLCIGSTVPAFVGILEGDPSDPAWPVWLRAEDGHRMYMTWPKGFSVRFDPDATLLDENGSPVLHAGSPFTFQGVAHDPSEGTRDRPYLAAGAWETGMARVGHCYHRPVDLVRDVRPVIVTIGIALALAFALSLVLTG